MRYTNPHPGQPAMFPQAQPQMQMQPAPVMVMMTPQGPAMMTPQGMVSVQLQQTPQGPMMMTPQGMVPVQIQGQQQQMMPQGQGMMAMHGGTMPMMQGQYPQQQFQQQQYPQQQFPSNNQSVVQSRFGQPSAAMETITTQMPDTSNRYHTAQTQQAQQQQMQPAVEEPTRPMLFTVTPVVHKFSGNEKFKMNVVTEAVKPNQVNYEEGYLACDCLEENVECVIEQAYKGETTPVVTVRNYIINNNFWRVDLKDTIDNLLSGDIKALYKAFKAAYTKMTNKSEINVLNVLNTALTDVTNDFLAVNSVAMISIESFYTDFNDLLRVIRNSEEDLEEELLSYLNNYVDDMKIALTNTTKTPNATQITEMVSVAYVDKHLLETGLDELDHRFVQVDDSIANAFLKSVAAEVIAKVGKQEFLLVTLDKSIFKFMVSTSANIFIKKIA